MPIVEGRYEAKISTTFRSADEGIDKLKGKIKKSRKVSISNIPMSLLKELTPLLRGKDVRIILPLNEEPPMELKELGDIAVTKSRVYKDFKGTEANSGSVYFADSIFGITWHDDKILEIATMEYGRCVKCMKESIFEMAWRYSQKYR